MLSEPEVLLAWHSGSICGILHLTGVPLPLGGSGLQQCNAVSPVSRGTVPCSTILLLRASALHKVPLAAGAEDPPATYQRCSRRVWSGSG